MPERIPSRFVHMLAMGYLNRGWLRDTVREAGLALLEGLDPGWMVSLTEELSLARDGIVGDPNEVEQQIVEHARRFDESLTQAP